MMQATDDDTPHLRRLQQGVGRRLAQGFQVLLSTNVWEEWDVRHIMG
jgi:hypothetical protein